MKNLLIVLLAVSAKVAIAGGDFCVATKQYGPEGAPSYNYKVICNNEKPAYTKDKWCWTNNPKCLAEVQSRLDTLLGSKGYSQVAKYKFSQMKYSEYVLQLYQKTSLIKNKGQKYCLALRYRVGGTKKPFNNSKLSINYRVDCDDKSLTELNDMEASPNSLQGISEFMKERGYSLSENIIDPDSASYGSKVVFKKE